MSFLALYIQLLPIILDILQVYAWIVILYCLLSMAIGYQVLGPLTRLGIALYNVLGWLVEPALRPIQALLPNTGAFDFSPVILLLVVDMVIPWLLRVGLQALYAS
ncbi:YggT family protein [Formicincola oecophyllae]|uniref:YggT family protein n=1 Tax=Formicincola oecophyllae TaxID=2558361 RepID=UPI00143CE15B|nr:YggT family protein [Formicincola oecophyllae]